MSGPFTRIDVARRQLVTAIQLFFDGGDPVSVYSLAANAWEVVDVLCTRTNVSSMSNDTREHVPAGRDLKRDYVNSPFRNFFKHADRDPDATLENFGDSTVDSILILAVEDYIRLNNRSPVEFQVFQLWYVGTHSDKVADAALAKVLRAVDRYLPNIRTLARPEQIAMGKAFLLEGRSNQALLADARTEASL